LEGDEDARSVAVREVAEETGVADVALGPEVRRRRHIFTWRGVRWDRASGGSWRGWRTSSPTTASGASVDVGV
jgi:8-oxo-dGTP pyrophosphatase MutT (NUDIX family)